MVQYFANTIKAPDILGGMQKGQQMAANRQAMQQRSQQMDMQKAEAERNKMDREAEITGRVALGIKNAPMDKKPIAYANARKYLEKAGIDTSSYPAEYTPEVESLLDQSLAVASSVKTEIASQRKIEAAEVANQRRMEEADIANQRMLERDEIQQGYGLQKLDKTEALRDQYAQKEFSRDIRLEDYKSGLKMKEARQKNKMLYGDPEGSKAGGIDLGGVHIRNLAQTKAGIQQQKMFDRKVKEDIRGSIKDISKLTSKINRFENAMKVMDTGPYAREKAYAGALLPGKSKKLTAYQQMRSIGDELARGQRKAGEGVFTDADMQVFRNIVVGPEKTKEFNSEWIKAAKEADRLAKEKSTFMRDFERKYNNLQGAESIWQTHMEANPVFTPDSTSEKFEVNKDRQSWRQFFANGGAKMEEEIYSRKPARQGVPTQRPQGEPSDADVLRALGM